MDAHDHFIAGLDDVADGRFHSRHPSSRKRDGHLVFRLEQMPQKDHGVVHDLQEIRIEISQDGAGHGLEHPRVEVAGTRPEQHARLVTQLVEILVVGSHGGREYDGPHTPCQCRSLDWSFA